MKCNHGDIIWNKSQAIVWNGKQVVQTGKPDMGTCQICNKEVWAKDIYSEIKLVEKRNDED